jgi:hypothetical protein
MHAFVEVTSWNEFGGRVIVKILPFNAHVGERIMASSASLFINVFLCFEP